MRYDGMMEQVPTTLMRAHRSLSTPPPMPDWLAGQWDYYAKQVLGRGVEPLQWSNILDEVGDMSGRLHLRYKPRIYVAEAFDPIFGGRGANAVALLGRTPELGGVVAVTRRMLEMYECTAAHSPVVIELKGHFGHELGHLKQGISYMEKYIKWPLTIGPIAGFAAMYLYNKATAKAVEAGTDAVTEIHLNAAAQEAMQSSGGGEAPAETNRERIAAQRDIADSANKWKQSVVSAGKYLVAAALGLGAGALVSRHMRMHMEFDADRTAAILVKDPEAIVRGLQRILEDWRQLPELQLQVRKQVGQWNVWDKIQHRIFNAYPTEAERFARLRALTKEELNSIPATIFSPTHAVAESLHP
jgi:Zn-dependent protease with chaperone function